MATLRELCNGLPLNPLPARRFPDKKRQHAPVRIPNLNQEDKKLALRNALRYFPVDLHSTLAPEFLEELDKYGHIYMYRFMPQIEMKAYPINEYPAKCPQAAAMMHMIMNNLDPKVAQFPEELITYGGNGQVLSNWAQFWILMNYLSILTNEQTLVMYSGHPMGLFPSNPMAPRCVITNGMMIPYHSPPIEYKQKMDYDRLFALGVTMYGQMTAGSYCYIGPQGIVHGTTLTIMNAGRKYLSTDDLSGKVYVTSGLGGMSGAQAKAAVISGCIGVIAEVDKEVVLKRFNQGWLMEWTDNLDTVIDKIRSARKEKAASLSIGYHGNVVDLWERLAVILKENGELLVDLGSDQTSLHNPYGGGYYPVQLEYEEAKNVLATDPTRFKKSVQESLIRQVNSINELANAGMYFWDYGNSFLLEAGNAGAEVFKIGDSSKSFRYPSYVQHIMGDIFSLGFGPFRWVCTSGLESDLEITDNIALEVFDSIVAKGVSESVAQQYRDNSKWIREAKKHNLVVGSLARILYSNVEGRTQIALKINEAISNKIIKGPVVLSRDHHDVSGADSPFRETSNIEDGSQFCADMAIHNVIGDSFRGATWVAIHNGGGVGWGKAINGGFGLVLDGSPESSTRAKDMLYWDVMNGISRRAWSGHKLANETLHDAVCNNSKLILTTAHETDVNILNIVN